MENLSNDITMDLKNAMSEVERDLGLSESSLVDSIPFPEWVYSGHSGTVGIVGLSDCGRPDIDPTSTPHRPDIDPTSTPHRPHIDPTSTLHRHDIDMTSTRHRHNIDMTST
ncbi:hypothetical protein AC249_AIPGENE19902 [Exaiptasia diaphana]|nr:hypothetical protein AC249_AIPGENE19902 [Exaiptasia diaphana]